MIPRIAQRGHSFVGAGLYYLHDKGESTSERVAFTETVNLPMQNAQKALQFMAYSASLAEEKKQEAGIERVGATQTAGAVYCYSLSWHPQEMPDKEEMRRCAQHTLQCLGLSEHEAVYVAHSDTLHAHIHVIVNLVHPETGKIGDIAFDQRKLQAWALAYERKQGEIQCPEREKNAQRRQQGEAVKYQDARHPLAERVALLFEQSDSGEEFVSMMEEQGVTVAQGDKGRIVMVDGEGTIQNLTRQLPGGIGKKQVLAKLEDVGVERLPLAHHVVQARKKPSEGDGDAEGRVLSQEEQTRLSAYLEQREKAYASPYLPDMRQRARNYIQWGKDHPEARKAEEDARLSRYREEDDEEELSPIAPPYIFESLGMKPVSRITEIGSHARCCDVPLEPERSVTDSIHQGRISITLPSSDVTR